MEDELLCCFILAANVVRGGVWQFVYDRPAFLERDLVGLCVNGNWQSWVQYCGGETVSIHMVRKGMAGFSNVKSITLSTLKLVEMGGFVRKSCITGYTLQRGMCNACREMWISLPLYSNVLLHTTHSTQRVRHASSLKWLPRCFSR